MLRKIPHPPSPAAPVFATRFILSFVRYPSRPPPDLRGCPQPSSESLKKLVDGKVALMEGEQERSLPGGEAEGKFCVSLSKLLHLDEVGWWGGGG